MLEFNSRNIIAGYIKNLLSSVYLPTCKLFSSEEEMREYFSTSSTYSLIPSINDNLIAIIKNYRNGRDYFVSINQNLNISPIRVFRYNHYYPNLVKKLRLENDLYDSYTHRYLGDYLRFIKDYFDLNLMSLYNCFDDTIEVVKNKKYLVIPIKYNKEYSIITPPYKNTKYII